MEMMASNADVEAAEEALAELEEQRASMAENPFGTPAALITHAVDVSDFVTQKHASMVAHESQISDESFFMKMPPEMFAMAFGTEWFIKHGGSRAPDAPFGSDLFEGIT